MRGLGIGFPVTSEQPGRIGVGETAEFSWLAPVAIESIQIYSASAGSLNIYTDDQFLQTVSFPGTNGSFSIDDSITASKIELEGASGLFRIQSLTVAAVPEPSSLLSLGALVIVGFGLSFVRQRGDRRAYKTRRVA
ncbi:MAG: PEP-CTERM sorting domain-containing protein [Planctomycetota bacterium]